MELAKVLASKGLGLQDLLLKGLGRAEYSKIPKLNQLDTENAGSSEESVGPPAAVSASAPAAARVSPAPAAPSTSVPHTHEPLEETSFPVRDGGRISSGFGYRKDPFTGADKFHHGMDIAAPEGTPVYPVKGGEVTFSGYQQGYGNVVVIDHGDGFVTKYGHNRANRVAVGDRVDTGKAIAEVGSTGRSTGPHVHFEVQYEGKKINPQTVFAGTAKGRG
ncbi:MAG: M23 family metallopeptidase [Deltaproteobacteria bacterium]|nr:M23 family metallopeptidase [Deltaproteobacteria bacterium]